MKKYLLFLLTTFLWSIQVLYAQKQGYINNFSSAQQIRTYLAKNVALLDPLEGEYDMDSYGEYITPYVHQYYPHSSSKLFIVCNNNNFNAYLLLEGRFDKTDFSIKSIGETNAYWMYYHSTSTRIYLKDNISFNASFKLDHSTAKRYTGNNNLSPLVNVLLYNDCIKIYPTSVMYANATRKATEETQPKEWTGTGFALTNNYIATNNHVVDGAKTINIQGINGDFNHKYNAEVIATDKVNDLAIIKVNGVNIQSSSIPYSVKTGTSEVGEEVFVLGYPLTSTMGEEIKLTTGVVSSKTGFQGDVSIYQISAPIQPGNSGGPLFDSKGNVIGVVSAKHKGAENVGYAIKTSYLKNLMESAVSTNILPQTNKMAGQNLSGKVKMAQNYVYYITCSNNGIEYESSEYSTNVGQSPLPQNNYQRYIEAAKNGDPEAQFRIGVCFHTGDGVAKDYKKAAYWWQIGADQGDASCQFNLGLSYIKGEGVSLNKVTGAMLVKKAAEQEMPEAQSILATYYRDGIGVPKDIKKAFGWWEKAANQGDVSSQVNLGVCYANGYGVVKDIAKAKFWFGKAAAEGSDVAKKNLESLNKEIEQEHKNSALLSESKTNPQNDYQKNIEAAENGDPIAQLKIGICYQTGNGIKKDETKALEWYKKSANQGNADAQTCLGLCYGMGLGVAEDFSQAIKWWRKAANQGNAQAQYYLGNCYNHGTGVSVDNTHAALWYQKAADNGNANAQFMLGVYYSTGTGVQKSASEAASWWLKAAIQGHVDAQYLIGICYDNGEGIGQDKREALYWYKKAADQGHQDAKNKIK